MEPPDRVSPPAWRLIEQRKPLSQSLIWSLQREYFAAMGVEAWRQGEVPHYVTSNPTMAKCYADIVMAFMRDRRRLGDVHEPLHICELGAGSGRFAFHFLSRLGALCEQMGIPLESFRYILTDFTPSNRDYWLGHARFRPYFDRGVLDASLFDLTAPAPLALRSGETIGAGALGMPIIVIANYVFDSIPHDLVYIDAHEARQCLVSLEVDADPETLTAADLLARLRLDYDVTVDRPAYHEPWLGEILAEYQRLLTQTYVMFPADGLRGLEFLRAMSRAGMLLLSADTGDHRIEALDGREPPAPRRHGSVSIPVNYHAISAYCQQHGGIALFPDTRPHTLNVSACLMVRDAVAHAETRGTYTRVVRDFGPDDFYTISTHARETLEQMTVADILAYLRLSHYDAHQLSRYLPRLGELASDLSRDERASVVEMVNRVWELYLPLGEPIDLADGIARLLYSLDEYGLAIEYFERSVQIYGEYTGTRANMAVCRQLAEEQEPTRETRASAAR